MRSYTTLCCLARELERVFEDLRGLGFSLFGFFAGLGIPAAFIALAEASYFGPEIGGRHGRCAPTSSAVSPTRRCPSPSAATWRHEMNASRSIGDCYEFRILSM